MRWQPGSGNAGDVQDLRGRRGAAVGLPIGGGVVGIVVWLLVTVLGGGASGFDVMAPLDAFPAAPAASGNGLDGAPDPERELVDFVGFVITDVQQTWEAQFAAAGRRYERTRLVLFTDSTSTGCGQGTSGTGPFYCGADRKVYVDLDFFRELRRRFGAPGDFAQAYVIAHEVGHHVQELLGVSGRVRDLSAENRDDANELSIRQELQADCFAGIWAHSTYQRRLLEEGDLEEGLTAAAAVGDDRIQQSTTGRVDPESWTHGSSEQRTKWFTRGFESGEVEACDTFAPDDV